MNGSRPHARFAARAAGLRHNARRRWAAWGAVVVVAAMAAWVVLFSSLLAVRTVEVTGAPAGLADEVRNRADLAIGTPLVRADTANVRARVAGLPGVRAVQVSRSLPNTLEVQVTPRTPVLVIKQAGTLSLVDSEGVAYQQVSSGPAAVPQVTLAADAPRQGPVLASLATVLAALTPADRAQVSGVRLSKTGQVSFTIGAIAVEWGDATRSARKAQAWSTVRPIAVRDKAGRVDVSEPDRPVLG